MNQEMEEMLEQMDSSRYLQNMDAGEIQFLDNLDAGDLKYIENLDLSAFQPLERNNFMDNYNQVYEAIPIDLMGGNQQDQ